MQHDFDIIVHKFGSEDITIYPIGDVHLGSPECMEQEFITFINRVKDEPNSYLLLLGDLCDLGLKNALTDVYRATMPPSQQKREMANILAPVAHKVLAAVSGNHEYRGVKEADNDVTRDVLAKIDREDVYRENIAFVKLQFGDRSLRGMSRPAYTLGICHGNGGGAMMSGALLRGEKFGMCLSGDVDGLVYGHTHKNITAVNAKLHVDARNNFVTLKPFHIINSTSWLEYGGYAARKMLMPSIHNIQRITLCGDHKEMLVTM